MRTVSKWVVSLGVGAGMVLSQVLLVGIGAFALTSGIVYGAGNRLLLDNPAGVVSRNENDRARNLGLVAGSLLVYTPLLTFQGSFQPSRPQRVGVAVLLFGSMLTMWLFGSTYERARSGAADESESAGR